MFKVVIILQQMMTGLNEAVSEEDNITTISKTVMKLINNEYYNTHATQSCCIQCKRHYKLAL